MHSRNKKVVGRVGSGGGGCTVHWWGRRRASRMIREMMGMPSSGLAVVERQ